MLGQGLSRKTCYKKFLFYFVFSLFILWTTVEPHIRLTLKDGFLIILTVFLVHSWIEKRYLLEKLSAKFMSQKVFLNNLFMNCPSLIYTKDENLNYIDCNPQMKKLLNIDNNSNVTGKNDFDLFPSDTAETLREYDKKVIEKRQVVSYKIEKKLFTGETKIYDTLLAPIIYNNNISGVLGIMRDITQTEKLKEKLFIKNAQLKGILDNVPFIIYLKDIEGRIITCNKILEKVLNLPKEQIIGTKPTDTFLKEVNDIVKKEDSTVISEKKTLIEEYNINLIADAKNWYRITKAPIINNQDDVIGIIVHIKNINEEKKLQAQKETLVATLTHDLKTPTTAQMNAMNLLLKGNLGALNDDQKEMVQLTLDSNIYMSNMISTILATYKSEDGKIKLKLEQLDFNELVNSTCKEIANLATTKKQNIVLNTNGKNISVVGDKLQLKRAIVNLVSNAITYGFDKTDIEISLNEDDKNIMLDVKNQSHYIPPERLKEIFEKYKTAESAKFNKASTGLGLYLSKEIIKAHNGEIHASSNEDKTCVFGFSMPKSLEPTTFQAEQLN